MTQPLPVSPPERPLLAAKYTVPPIRPGGVVRARLHALMQSNAATRLTVVTSPAGWGKTTFLSQWAHSCGADRRVAWVSLDESDDEPVRFWHYVLTALGAHGVGFGALAALRAPGADPVDVAVPTLLNELGTADDVVVVLDDYHLVTDARLHESVEFLLAYLPASARLVIAGRADPPLPLARLRARGELTEIRATDLCFSPQEAGALVASVGAVGLDAEAMDGLCERTEGWAAGLQLAALTLRGSSAPAEVAAQIRGDDRHILDYFAAEVVTRLRSEQRDLLVRSSVLERLSGPLCDAVLERSDSAALLSELDRTDLFVVPLDRSHEWYRCHRLFRDALRYLLDPATAGVVLGRAADWFLEHGHLADAIAHRILAGDDQGAAELLRSSVPWFLERAALVTYLQLGDRVDRSVAESDARLCVAMAWAAGLSGQFVRMGPWLDAADVFVTDDAEPLAGWNSLRAAWATMRAVQRQSEADLDDALRWSQLAVSQETDASLPGYVVSRLILGTVLQTHERFSEAVPVLIDAWQRAGRLGLPTLLGLQAACSLAFALLGDGRYDEAARLCTRTAAQVHAVELAWGDAAAPGIARLQLVKARLAQRTGDVPAAQQLARCAAVQSRRWGLASQVVMALTTLAEAEVAAGDRAAARAALAEAAETVGCEPVWPFVARELEAVEVRIGRGTARAARRAGALVEELTDRELSILRMLPGSANQREIGAALFLSINTVKGYTKALYRKLDVATRQDAVDRARGLGLI